MPAKIGSYVFRRGRGLDVLYVTSGTVFLEAGRRAAQPRAGALLAVHGLGVPGVPEPLFGGRGVDMDRHG